MRSPKLPQKCRICGSNITHNINLGFPKYLSPYLYRSDKWSNIFCAKCNGVSHYPSKEKDLVKYSDSSYRKDSISDRPQSPISLPWSTITSLRSRHINKLIKSCDSSAEIISNKELKLLDYGGYNGFTAFGLKTYLNIKQIAVADLDPNGLKIASALGMEIIDLSKKSLEESGFNEIDLCIGVQVLEHLENPSLQLKDIHKSLKNNGLVYIEVPNLYGATLSEPSHLISYTKESLLSLISRNRFEILDFGFTSTPREAIRYGYPSSSWHECIYCIAKKSEVLLNTHDDYVWQKRKRLNNFLGKPSLFSTKKFLLKIIINNLIYMLVYPYNICAYIFSLLLRLLKEIVRLVFSPYISILFIIKNLSLLKNRQS